MLEYVTNVIRVSNVKVFMKNRVKLNDKYAKKMRTCTNNKYVMCVELDVFAYYKFWMLDR